MLALACYKKSHFFYFGGYVGLHLSQPVSVGCLRLAKPVDLATLNFVSVFVSVTAKRLWVVLSRPAYAALLHPEAAVVDAPAKISARDALMENG